MSSPAEKEGAAHGDPGSWPYAFRLKPSKCRVLFQQAREDAKARCFLEIDATLAPNYTLTEEDGNDLSQAPWVVNIYPRGDDHNPKEPIGSLAFTGGWARQPSSPAKAGDFDLEASISEDGFTELLSAIKLGCEIDFLLVETLDPRLKHSGNGFGWGDATLATGKDRSRLPVLRLGYSLMPSRQPPNSPSERESGGSNSATEDIRSTMRDLRRAAGICIGLLAAIAFGVLLG